MAIFFPIKKIGCAGLIKKSFIPLAILFVALLASCQQNGNTANKYEQNKNENLHDTILVKNTSLADSIDRANNENIVRAGDDITKAYVIKNDSSIFLKANMQRDHRFFGYERPDIKSQRLLLLSVYTTDVSNNPFKCILGAYYDTGGMEGIHLKYLATEGNFIKVSVTGSNKKQTIIFFEKKWIEFEK